MPTESLNDEPSVSALAATCRCAFGGVYSSVDSVQQRNPSVVNRPISKVDSVSSVRFCPVRIAFCRGGVKLCVPLLYSRPEILDPGMVVGLHPVVRRL